MKESLDFRKGSRMKKEMIVRMRGVIEALSFSFFDSIDYLFMYMHYELQSHKQTWPKQKTNTGTICVSIIFLSSIVFVHAQAYHESPYSIQLKALIIQRKVKITLEKKNQNIQLQDFELKFFGKGKSYCLIQRPSGIV